MGAHIAILAIKEKDENKVMLSVQNYYALKQLRIVEEGIGGRESEFMEKPHEYGNALEFKQRAKKENPCVNEFDFFTNLDENSNYSIFLYGLATEKPALHLDEELSAFLSKELNTEVIEYQEYNYKNRYLIRTHVDGLITDVLAIDTSVEIQKGEGIFSKFSNIRFEDINELLTKVVFPFLDEKHFFPESEELIHYDINKWRPYRLEPQGENLKNYLLTVYSNESKFWNLEYGY